MTPRLSYGFAFVRRVRFQYMRRRIVLCIEKPVSCIAATGTDRLTARSLYGMFSASLRGVGLLCGYAMLCHAMPSCLPPSPCPANQHKAQRYGKTAKSQKENKRRKEYRIRCILLYPAQKRDVARVVAAGVEHIESVPAGKTEGVLCLVECQRDKIHRQIDKECAPRRADYRLNVVTQPQIMVWMSRNRMGENTSGEGQNSTAHPATGE